VNLGNWLVRIAFVLALVAAIRLVPTLRRPQVGSPRGAGWILGLHAWTVVAALLLLVSHFVGHRFEYDYVAQYSSRALSPALSLAAVWAGQEGSILLWAAFGGLVGLALWRQPGSLAKPALFFVSIAQAWLLGLLLIRSPFVRHALPPAEGMGLNPLLEDPWMVFHPPVLFVGYASLVAPFALAAAALVRRQHADWNRMVWPWALFAVVSLGTGIALGGVWAYKVLGWGGYWGWDPVENASLVPWLVSVGLVHGLLIQRATRALVRTNLLLALLAWITVVGGTYLTRSGVLQAFSVHSFADSGLNVPLIAFLVAATLASAGLLIARWRSFETGQERWLELSRESALWLGLMTVLVLAALVALGTTAPLLTALAGRPASVNVKYYEYVSVPLGVVLVLLMALAPALRWSRQQGLSWVGTLAPGLIAGVVLPLIAVLAGLRDQTAMALTAISGLALGVNASMSARLLKRGWTYGAGYLVHVGIAVMVLGMVISSVLGKTERLRLLPGRPVSSLGYTLTFQGTSTGARGERTLQVHVERGPWRFEARPVLVKAPRDEGLMRKPAIDGWKDLYLSPLELQPVQSHGEPIWLAKGQEVTLGQAGVTFTGFRMTSHEDLVVYADLRVRKDGRIVEAAPGVRAAMSGSQPIPVEVPDLGQISLARIDADNKRVAVLLSGGLGAGPAALVELSTKPMVNLVWIGALLALLGSGLAGLRRAVEKLPARSRLKHPLRPGVAEATH
jgi:cytochrome c-type biogenesis protein CcmF